MKFVSAAPQPFMRASVHFGEGSETSQIQLRTYGRARNLRPFVVVAVTICCKAFSFSFTLMNEVCGRLFLALPIEGKADDGNAGQMCHLLPSK